HRTRDRRGRGDGGQRKRVVGRIGRSGGRGAGRGLPPLDPPGRPARRGLTGREPLPRTEAALVPKIAYGVELQMPTDVTRNVLCCREVGNVKSPLPGAAQSAVRSSSEPKSVISGFSYVLSSIRLLFRAWWAKGYC